MVSLPLFYLYAVMLVLSGVTMLALAIGGFGQRVGARIAEALFGAGFLGYGVYLLFFFHGGEFRMFFYAFVAPVLAVVHLVRARRHASPARPAPPAAFAPPAFPTQSAAYPTPAAGFWTPPAAPHTPPAAHTPQAAPHTPEAAPHTQPYSPPAPWFTPANGLVPATAPLGTPLPPRQPRRTGSSTSL